MDEQAERMQILDRIESGEISVDEGLQLIETLVSDVEPTPGAPLEPVMPEMEFLAKGAESHPLPESTDTTERLHQDYVSNDQAASSTADVSTGGIPVEAEKWRRYWLFPMWIGIGFTALGGILLSLAMQSTWPGLWLACATVPLTIGLLLIMLAGYSRGWPWLHLRVQQKSSASPRNFAISFPLPVRPAVWIVRNFGQYIPAIRDTALDEALLSLEQVTSAENPIYIQVDDDEDDEKVEIYIG